MRGDGSGRGDGGIHRGGVEMKNPKVRNVMLSEKERAAVEALAAGNLSAGLRALAAFVERLPPQRRGAVERVTTTVYLDEDAARILKELGDGNLSEGVRRGLALKAARGKK